jgi:GTPase SAR1 family protein
MVRLTVQGGAYINMTIYTVSEVFGVSNKMVLSYLERNEVDGEFITSLKTDRHIVVYGASKQGKTSLLSRHVSKEESITIECGPKTDCQSIYQSLLRQLDIKIERTETQSTGTEGKVKAKIGLKAFIPFIGSADTELESEVTGKADKERQFDQIEYNLELAQDVGELLRKIKFSKYVVLENFHYLNDEVQTELAFDLRIFQDMEIRFIILGVWREKNRLVVYNGDLTDRISEVPVEPWLDKEFFEVIKNGATLLNVNIDEQIQKDIIEVSFGSIAIVQELCKEFVEISGIENTVEHGIILSDRNNLEKAINKKVLDYQARHLKSLESIAGGLVTNRPKDGKFPLILPYYTVRVLVEVELSVLLTGISRNYLHDRIRDVHHRPPEEVRAGDITNLLNGLANLQKERKIVPPLFDYDHGSRSLKVIDSTLYFYLKNVDRKLLLSEIPNPLDTWVPDE